MSCYLLFKKPMKYLVPRGSGRPTLFVIEFQVANSQYFRVSSKVSERHERPSEMGSELIKVG